MKIKAAIFDMDGVLIDSMPLWKKTIKQIVTDLGSEFTSPRWEAVRAKRIDEIFQFWYEHFGWEEETSPDEATEQALKTVKEKIKKSEKIKPGAKEAMDFFDEKNIPIALASSSFDEIINTVLESLEIEEYFTLTHSAEHEDYGKPHPSVYIRTAEKLDVKPEKCIVFEDSVNGAIASKAASMHCVPVPETNVSPNTFCMVDKVIYSLNAWNEEYFKKIKNKMEATLDYV